MRTGSVPTNRSGSSSPTRCTNAADLPRPVASRRPYAFVATVPPVLPTSSRNSSTPKKVPRRRPVGHRRSSLLLPSTSAAAQLKKSPTPNVVPVAVENPVALPSSSSGTPLVWRLMKTSDHPSLLKSATRPLNARVVIAMPLAFVLSCAVIATMSALTARSPLRLDGELVSACGASPSSPVVGLTTPGPLGGAAFGSVPVALAVHETYALANASCGVVVCAAAIHPPPLTGAASVTHDPGNGSLRAAPTCQMPLRLVATTACGPTLPIWLPPTTSTPPAVTLAAVSTTDEFAFHGALAS